MARSLTTGKRPRSVGRWKGTPGMSALAVIAAMLRIFAHLLAEAAGEVGNFLDQAIKRIAPVAPPAARGARPVSIAPVGPPVQADPRFPLPVP